MNILDCLAEYESIPALAERWKLGDRAQEVLFWTILKHVLRPAYWLRGRFPEVVRNADGNFEPLHADGLAVVHEVNSWTYPVNAEQVGAHDLHFPMVCDRSEPIDRLLLLPAPLTLADVIRDGVVMRDENLQEAEQALRLASGAWQSRSAATKKLQMHQALLAAVLADAYHYDPRDEAGARATLRTISDGAGVHQQTVARYVAEAVSNFPPAYLAKPLKSAEMKSLPER